jgi:hypothetical protein
LRSLIGPPRTLEAVRARNSQASTTLGHWVKKWRMVSEAAPHRRQAGEAEAVASNLEGEDVVEGTEGGVNQSRRETGGSEASPDAEFWRLNLSCGASNPQLLLYKNPGD